MSTMKLRCIGVGREEDNGTFSLNIKIEGFETKAMTTEVGEEISAILQVELKKKFGGTYINIFPERVVN